MGIFILFFSSLFTSYGSLDYETISIDKSHELLNSVDWQEHYIGKIRLFSYGSTESCIYRTNNIIFIENYCYPKRNYPAKSFTIISHDIGHLSFYQEEGAFEVRSISLDTFKKDLALDFPKSFKGLSKEDINRLLETSYKRYLPACWASFRIKPEKKESFSCYPINPHDHADWLQDSAKRVLDPQLWNTTYKKFKDLLK